MIDFYNIKYYGDLNSTYLTYENLFIKANGSYGNTSVREIAQRGFSLNKIVVGKSTVAGVSGAIADVVLRDWANRARQELGWSAGFWLGELTNDSNGSSIMTALSLLRNHVIETNYATKNTTNTSINNQTNTTPDSTTSNTTANNTPSTVLNSTINLTTNVSTVNSSIPYPVYFVYVNSVSAWWGD
jgi:hypothetical protein